jgi:hypothetical protein
MKQIRFGVFETNSSSTHSLTIVTLEDFKKFENGELWYDQLLENLVEAPAYIPPPKVTDFEDDEEDVISFDSFNDIELEYFEKHFITPSGDEMVAFGHYGNDR